MELFQFQRLGHIFTVTKPKYQLVTLFHTFTDHACFFIKTCKFICPSFIITDYTTEVTGGKQPTETTPTEPTESVTGVG